MSKFGSLKQPFSREKFNFSPLVPWFVEESLEVKSLNLHVKSISIVSVDIHQMGTYIAVDMHMPHLHFTLFYDTQYAQLIYYVLL